MVREGERTGEVVCPPVPQHNGDILAGGVHGLQVGIKLTSFIAAAGSGRVGVENFFWDRAKMARLVVKFTMFVNTYSFTAD